MSFSPQLQDIFFHRHMLINTLFNTTDELLHCPLSLFLYLWGCVCVCIEVHYSILQTQVSTLLAFLKIHFSLLNSWRLPPSDWVLSHPAACKLSLIVSDNNPRVQLVYSPILTIDSVQFSSVTQSCPPLCDPMNYSMPGLPVHHQLLEPTQTHVHWVGDAIQPFHAL